MGENKKPSGKGQWYIQYEILSENDNWRKPSGKQQIDEFLIWGRLGKDGGRMGEYSLGK